MPRPTFFNLPQAKQQKVIESIISEFSQYPLSQGSVARIVKKADIARGSFYQYFDDLEDAYYYVLGLVGEKKMAYLRPVLHASPDLPVMDLFKRLFRAGVQFGAEHPQLAKMGALFLQEEKRIRQEVVAEEEEGAIRFYHDLLMKGKQTGEIASDLDLHMAAFVLFHSQMALMERARKQMEWEEGSDVLQEFMTEFDHMLELILYGIIRRES